MNVNEIGVVFRFNADYDMSANTGLSLTFTLPSGDTLTRDKTTSSAVSLGLVDVSTTLGTFTANEYVEYSFASGEVDEAGTWQARLTYSTASVTLISEVATFTVGE